MDTIKCPVCGETNPSALENCQNCGQLLRQTTSELKGTGEIIDSGQVPTKKKTSELESALPAWLRGARQGEKENQEETPPASEDAPLRAAPPPAAEPETNDNAAPLDWLAGLDDEDEDEEAADWLVNLQGDLAAKEKPEEIDQGISAADEPITANDAPRPSDEEEPPIQRGELPGWISDLQSESETQEDIESLPELIEQKSFDAPQEFADEGDTESGELPDWLSKLSKEADSTSSTDETPSFQPDPISTADADSPSIDTGDDLPDWMADLKSAAETSIEETSPSIVDADLPAQLAGEDDSQTEQALSMENDLPDWMTDLQPATETSAEDTAPAIAGDDLPDWITQPAAESPVEKAEISPSVEDADSPALAESGTLSSGDLPDWLSSLPSGDFSAEDTEKGDDFLAEDAFEVEANQKESEPSIEIAVDADETDIPPAEDAELPDWLSKMGKPSTGSPAEEKDEAPTSTEEETPDWVASLPSVDEKDVEAALISAPAFVEGDDFSSPTEEDNVDEIFGIEMPDWLSSLGPAELESAEEDDEAASPKAEDDLSGAELPSWVQAMQPVAAVIPDSSQRSRDDEYMVAETGPLAGLSGILPVSPGIGQMNKPKAYSIKLRVSESQQSSATILEELLAGETEPSPFKPSAKASSIPVVRWLIAILLFFVVGSSLFSQTHIAPSPSIVVPEIRDTIEVINQLPDDGSALLIFDYEAGFSGEMQALAAPLVDHLMLRGEKLAIISTSPMGPALAERFLLETQSSHQYQHGEDYLNLGYLPGGASGMLSFMSNPQAAVPAQVDRKSVWNLPPLENVKYFSDFSVIVVLTADVEKGRAWVEQSAVALENVETPLLMAISAQAEPIIYPYYASGQVDGLVSGLSGGATYERLQGQQSGLGRKYWDSYSVGLFLAEILIAIGAMVNLLAALKARQKTQKDED